MLQHLPGLLMAGVAEVVEELLRVQPGQNLFVRKGVCHVEVEGAATRPQGLLRSDNLARFGVAVGTESLPEACHIVMRLLRFPVPGPKVKDVHHPMQAVLSPLAWALLLRVVGRTVHRLFSEVPIGQLAVRDQWLWVRQQRQQLELAVLYSFYAPLLPCAALLQHAQPRVRSFDS